MTTRMVAPSADWRSAIHEGIEYKFSADDRFGAIVDVHDVHVEAFRALGCTPASEMGLQKPIELIEKDEIEAKAAAEKAAAEQAASDQAKADEDARLEAEAKARVEAAEKAAADEAAAATATATPSGKKSK